MNVVFGINILILKGGIYPVAVCIGEALVGPTAAHGAAGTLHDGTGASRSYPFLFNRV